MRLLKFLFLFCLLNGCSNRLCKPYYSEKERLRHEVRLKTAMQLKKEKNLYLHGTGGGGMDKVSMLYLAFHYYEPIEIEQARELMIYAGNVFLKTINEDEKIRPHLINYPFQSKNIKITIFLKNPNGDSIDREKLCIIALDNAKLDYEVHDAHTNHLKTIHTETYEQAEEIVKKQAVSIELKR